VRDQLVADDRLRATVRASPRGLTTDRDKVRAIYGWVIAHTRYVALEFGIHGFKPYAGAADLHPGLRRLQRQGVGDRDHAPRGRRRRPRWCSSHPRPRARSHAEPASLAVFDHAIAYVPSLDLFLDGTAQHSGIDELPAATRG
jgi:hypothetical protein